MKFAKKKHLAGSWNFSRLLLPEFRLPNPELLDGFPLSFLHGGATREFGNDLQQKGSPFGIMVW